VVIFVMVVKLETRMENMVEVLVMIENLMVVVLMKMEKVEAVVVGVVDVVVKWW